MITANRLKNIAKEYGYRGRIFTYYALLEVGFLLLTCGSIFYALKYSKILKLDHKDLITLIVLPSVAFLFIWALYAFVFYGASEMPSNTLMMGNTQADQILTVTILEKLIEDENKIIKREDVYQTNGKVKDVYQTNGKVDLEKTEKVFINLIYKKEFLEGLKENQNVSFKFKKDLLSQENKSSSTETNNIQDENINKENENIIKNKNIVPFLRYISRKRCFKNDSNNPSTLYKLTFDVVELYKDKKNFKPEEVYDFESIAKVQKALFKDQKDFEKWMEGKFKNNDTFKKFYAATRGACGENSLSPLIKYPAKTFRYIVSGIYVGSLALFLARITKMMSDADKETKIFANHYTKELITFALPYVISFITTILFFIVMWKLHSISHDLCMDHAQQIYYNTWTDMSNVFGLKEREMSKLNNLPQQNLLNQANNTTNNDSEQKYISGISPLITLLFPLLNPNGFEKVAITI
jgi:hypothetical protein